MSETVFKKCRVCGCTENRACVTVAGPCSWVAEDPPHPAGPLCSACVADDVGVVGKNEAALVLRPEDLRALQRVDFGLRVDGITAFQLLAAIQLVCRHPEFQGPTRDTVLRVADLLEREVSVTKNLANIARAGWNPAQDVPAAPAKEESPLIPPPDFKS